MGLQGKAALITGSTSGIGRAVAERLASEGAEVIISGRDEVRGRDVVEAVEAAGGKARFIAADLASFADVRRLSDAAGDVDVLQLARQQRTRNTPPALTSAQPRTRSAARRRAHDSLGEECQRQDGLPVAESRAPADASCPIPWIGTANPVHRGCG